MSSLPDDTIASPLARPGMILGGRYRLASLLGRGGMGDVWRARDGRLERDVAIKLPAPGRLDDEGRERLLREARIAASLHHPGIVAVHDAGESDGQPFIVMELVEGRSLRERAPDAAIGARGVALQVLGALAHVHAGGIVHRDLKPENLLWSGTGEDAWLKLADLGIARLESQSMTREGAVVGTAAYLSPEQALGGVVDARADLYALGVVLYELEAGRTPFQGDNVLAVISQHVHAPPPPLSQHAPNVPPEFERFVMRLLEKSPDKRFASAEEALAALEAPLAEARPGASRSTLLDQLVRGRLVGRRPELDRLRGLWTLSQEERAQLALVSGEPGIGKSRLARELLVAARVEGASVLAGGCYEFEATTPYLPFVEAFTAWARGRDADEARAALGDSAPELARLVPEFDRLGPFVVPQALAPHEERLRLFEAVTRFLRTLASRRGLLVFLDDLHWADSGTLALIAYLLRQLRTDRVMLLGTYREVELDRRHPLAAAVVDWERERVATRIALGRLTRADTNGLLATLLGQVSVSDDFGAAMHAETEGNPFFVEEVVKSLIDRGQIYREGGEWHRQDVTELAIPQSVKSAIGHRLDRLEPGCADVLRLAAVLGKSFAFADLEASSDVNEDALLVALEAAMAAQLVSAREDETFVFTHDKIREVLYEELSPIRRRRAHQRIAEALAARKGTRPEDLAYHYLQTGDTASALRWTLAAADRAQSVYALEEAVTYLERARECADALGERTARLDVLTRLARVHGDRGEKASVLAVCEDALPLCESAAERVRINVIAGEMCVRVGASEAEAYLDAAHAELDAEQQPAEYVRVQASLARLHHYRTEHRRAIEILEGLTHHPAFLEDPMAPLHVYPYLAGAHQQLSEFEASMKWAHKALEFGRSTGDPLLESLGHEFLGEDYTCVGRPREALHHGEEDLRLGLRVGSLDRQVWAHMVIGLSRWKLGELAEARAVCEAGARLAEQLGERRVLCLIANFTAVLVAELAEDEAAAEWLARATTLAADLGQIHMLAECHSTRAQVALLRHDGAAALAEAREAVKLKSSGESRLNMSLYLATGALGAAMCGDEASEPMAREALAFCDDRQSDLGRGEALRALAEVHRSRGDLVGALHGLEAARDVHERNEVAVDLARVLADRARVLRELSRAAEADADLARARDIAATCGAVRLMAEIA